MTLPHGGDALSFDPKDGSQYEHYENFCVEYRDASHRYWLITPDGRFPVASVTTVLKVLDKPALQNWAEAAGIEGALILERRGELEGLPPEEAVDRVRFLGYGKDMKRDAAAGRGTAIHRVLESWCQDRTVPNVTDFPGEHRGYVQGLCRWLLEVQPDPLSMERCVGSLEHRFAGRLDLRARVDGRDCLVDLKTNPRGRVYDEAHLQARAYALAEEECGMGPPAGVVIVGVSAEGGFEMVECRAEVEDWLATLACYRAVSRLRRRKDPAPEKMAA